jgi:hypothetical protein
MLNRKSKSFLFLICTIVAGIPTLLGQTSTGNIRTTGNCSPVVIQPKDGFEIICHDSTLTRAEALKQAKQISELLSKLKATSQDNSEVIKKLDRILQQLNDMNAAASLSTAPIYTIPVIDGIATPDLSHGFTQRVVLHSDIVIAAPRLPHTSKNETVVWTLFVDQDATGEHKYTTDLLDAKTTWPGLVPNSRASYEFVTESSGRTVMRSVPIVNSLTPEAPDRKGPTSVGP